MFFRFRVWEELSFFLFLLSGVQEWWGIMLWAASSSFKWWFKLVWLGKTCGFAWSFQEAGEVDAAPHPSVWDQFHRVCLHPGASQDRTAAGFRSHSGVLPGMTSAGRSVEQIPRTRCSTAYGHINLILSKKSHIKPKWGPLPRISIWETFAMSKVCCVQGPKQPFGILSALWAWQLSRHLSGWFKAASPLLYPQSSSHNVKWRRQTFVSFFKTNSSPFSHQSCHPC